MEWFQEEKEERNSFKKNFIGKWKFKKVGTPPLTVGGGVSIFYFWPKVRNSFFRRMATTEDQLYLESFRQKKLLKKQDERHLQEVEKLQDRLDTLDAQESIALRDALRYKTYIEDQLEKASTANQHKIDYYNSQILGIKDKITTLLDDRQKKITWAEQQLEKCQEKIADIQAKFAKSKERKEAKQERIVSQIKTPSIRNEVLKVVSEETPLQKETKEAKLFLEQCLLGKASYFDVQHRFPLYYKETYYPQQQAIKKEMEDSPERRKAIAEDEARRALEKAKEDEIKETLGQLNRKVYIAQRALKDAKARGDSKEIVNQLQDEYNLAFEEKSIAYEKYRV